MKKTAVMMLPNQTGRRDVEATTPRACGGAGSGSDKLHYGIFQPGTANTLRIRANSA